MPYRIINNENSIIKIFFLLHFKIHSQDQTLLRAFIKSGIYILLSSFKTWKFAEFKNCPREKIFITF
jgi:hypothetical protein